MMAALSLLLFVALFLTVANAQLCEQLPDDTWESLIETLELSFGFAILCPFEIKGSGCPSDPAGYAVVDSIYMLCEGATSNQHACVIDCPGTHFTVGSGSSLTLDGFSIQGATTSAIQVHRSGVFSTFYSHFQQ